MDVSSYLDAMVALREFRIMVCQKCKTVLTSRLINFESNYSGLAIVAQQGR